MFFEEALSNDLVSTTGKYLSVWGLLESGNWVLYRSFPSHYAKQVALQLSITHYGRFHGCFPLSANPNWVEGGAA